MSPPTAAARRLVLVPAGSSDRADATTVRRYRLARLRLEGREALRADRKPLSPDR